MGFVLSGDLGPHTFYTNKNRKLVWFIKAPPLEPPTMWQIRNRNRFRTIAFLWKQLAPADREKWNLAATRAHLRITGYNLFMHHHCTRDESYIITIEHLSEISLRT